MSGGGFIVGTSTDGVSSSSLEAPNGQSRAAAAPLLSLTPRQEGKLRAHLDDRLLSLERDDRKGTLGPLPALIARLTPLLHLILQIPPISPWSSLRIAYLLSFTGSITSYITSLPLYTSSSGSAATRAPRSANGNSNGVNAESTASSAMRQVLDFLVEVERGWIGALKGDAWVMEPSDSRGRSVSVRFGAGLDTTERIRLRSIVLAGRERMLAWARTYGTFPGSRFDSVSENGDVDAVGPEWEWEHEVMAMWNGILEVLSSDLDGARGPSGGDVEVDS